MAPGLLFAQRAPALMGATNAVHGHEVVYIQLRAIGPPAVLTTLTSFGILHGLQDANALLDCHRRQRPEHPIFNQLWSANGAVIPFYFNIEESNIWFPHLAVKYFRAFASQYISFLEREEELVQAPLSLEEIREYGLAT